MNPKDDLSDQILTLLSRALGRRGAIRLFDNFATNVLPLMSPQIFAGNMQGNTIPLSSTQFVAPGGIGASNATEANVQLKMTQAGNLRNLRLTSSGAQPASGALVVTVRKNGVGTALTVTIPLSGVAAEYTDLVDVVAFVVGDLISIGLANAATGVSATLTLLSVEIGP